MGEGSAGWEQIFNEIPMPRIASDSRTWILERFVLQAGDREANGSAIFDQSLATGGHQVRHGMPFPDVAMEPESALHRVDHPLASQRELAIGRMLERAVAVDRSVAHARTTSMANQLQVMRPSRVDGATAEAVPKYTVHVSALSEE